MTLELLIIRQAKLEDAHNITQIISEKIKTLDYGDIEEVQRWLDDEHTLEHVIKRITSEDYITVVAELDRKFAGTAYLQLTSGYLGALYVNVERKGIGSKLLAERIKLAQTYNLSEVIMSVSSNNHRMLNLADQFGFKYLKDDPDKNYFPSRTFRILSKQL